MQLLGNNSWPVGGPFFAYTFDHLISKIPPFSPLQTVPWNPLKFYNREEEMKLLTNSSNIKPGYRPSKSWLIQHILSELIKRELPLAILQLMIPRTDSKHFNGNTQPCSFVYHDNLIHHCSDTSLATLKLWLIVAIVTSTYAHIVITLW